MPTIVVHGGCGAVSIGERDARTAACEKAADAGWQAMAAGGSALDAVEAAVVSMENEPLLNAGTGSYLQADGVCRMDASVMSSDGRAGAVAQVRNLKNPIRLARYILEQDAHVMLTGDPALCLATALGHETGVVATPQKIDYWRAHLDEACLKLDYGAMAAAWKKDNPRLGTVGAVALDSSGNLAAATSTGGTGQCYPGRIGDSPIIGAGTYCSKQAGVSMTGLGERVMVLLSAKRLCDLVADGRSLEAAGGAVMAEIEETCAGSAGLIALSAGGVPLVLWDTPFIACAVKS
jgi:L-asparaginase / beta-aspartyl-peptidase